MKKLIQYTGVLCALGLAGQAGAAPETLTGSDVLDQFVQAVIAHSPDPLLSPSTINYTGGGSSGGEQNTLLLKQEIVPLTANLTAARTCRSANPQAANCEVVALDGLSVIGGTQNTSASNTVGGIGACDGVAVKNQTVTVHPGGVLTNNNPADCASTTCPGNVYTFNNAFDALRIVYSGIDHAGGSNSANKKCAGDLRQSLVNQWGSIFLDSTTNPPTACASGTCTQLSHAFRYGDAFTTTSAFLSFLGLPSLPTVPVPNQSATQPNPYPVNPFCNGWDRDNADPVKRTCGSGASAADTVCEVTTGKAGLVVSVVVPDNLAPVDAYPTTACDAGLFDLKAARRTVVSGTGPVFECPEANYNIAGNCYAPYHLNGTTKEYNCLNTRANHGAAGNDGLAINRFLRVKASGALAVDSLGVPIGNAFYRLRNAACQQDNTTHNIGCLTQNVSCSIAFGGREAAAPPLGKSPFTAPALAIGDALATAPPFGLFPTDAAVGKIGTVYPGDPIVPGTYALARQTYLCAMRGLVNVATDAVADPLGAQASLVRSIVQGGNEGPGGTGTLASDIQTAGLVVPDVSGAGVQCVDFDETQCTASNRTTIACTTNADCGVFPCTASKCDFSCTSDAYCAGLQPGATCIPAPAPATGSFCGFASNSNSTAGSPANTVGSRLPCPQPP